MEKRTLWIVGGGLALLIIVYAMTRQSSDATNTVSVVPASSPADPNVLAAQVQQDAIRGQLALASINAAGTIDAINAQSAGQVKQIQTAFEGQGFLTKLQGAIVSNLAAQQYSSALGLAQIEGQTATELASIQSAPSPVTVSQSTASAPVDTSSSSGTATNRAMRLFALGSVAQGQTPTSTTQPVSRQTQVQQQSCWWRVHVPLIGALVC